MKCHVKKTASSRSIEVRIILESPEEADGFFHIIGCWENSKNCTTLVQCREIATQVFNNLSDSEFFSP